MTVVQPQRSAPRRVATGSHWIGSSAQNGERDKRSVGISRDEQAKAELRCIESDEGAVAFRPPT